jgi:hypothetical protein
MKRMQHFLWLAGMVSAIVVIAGCAQQAAIRNLPPTEQQEFRAYRNVMTSRQVRSYLSRETAAARAAYLREIGAVQRFQSLTAQDRQSVLAGHIRKGMSAEALHFLWGEPYYTEGRPGQYESWFYLGSSMDLAGTGNQLRNLGSQVQVVLVDGQVNEWMDFVPTQQDPGDTGDRGCEGC